VKSAVIVFPGSNCDRDLAVALELVTGRKPAMVWHKDSELPEGTDFIGVPGGFSYGDYLRSGAMAARSPIMGAIKDAASRGVPVIGICNGFQVLTEAGMLPGALMRNANLSFVCRDVALKVENSQSAFTLEAVERLGVRLVISVMVRHWNSDRLARFILRREQALAVFDAQRHGTPDEAQRGVAH
jgi:phosphoribosylformylglycinamidine synthase I